MLHNITVTARTWPLIMGICQSHLKHLYLGAGWYNAIVTEDVSDTQLLISDSMKIVFFLSFASPFCLRVFLFCLWYLQ